MPGAPAGGQRRHREARRPGRRLITPATVLSNITNLMLATGQRGKPDWIRKPLAIVFSKMDSLLPKLSPTSPLLQPPPRTAYLDERDSGGVLTRRCGGCSTSGRAPGSTSSPGGTTAAYRYFGVSALGENPTADNRVAARGIRPLRVADPFMWTLSQLGAIPVRRA